MSRPRILLGDDYPQILELLKILLELDYEVVGTVGDGRALLSTAQKLRPDIILTDVDMPILSGIEAVREIRKLQPDCCIIFHSSHAEQHIVASAYEAGASGYLIKGASTSLLSSLNAIVPSRLRLSNATAARRMNGQTMAYTN